MVCIALSCPSVFMPSFDKESLSERVRGSVAKKQIPCFLHGYRFSYFHQGRGEWVQREQPTYTRLVRSLLKVPKESTHKPNLVGSKYSKTNLQERKRERERERERECVWLVGTITTAPPPPPPPPSQRTKSSHQIFQSKLQRRAFVRVVRIQPFEVEGGGVFPGSMIFLNLLGLLFFVQQFMVQGQTHPQPSNCDPNYPK